MKPEDRDAGYLWDMLQTAREARELMQGVTLETLLSDIRTQRALERMLEIIGEAASRISEPMRGAHPEIPWIAIIGQRNIIAHGYAAIDYGRLFATVTNDIPTLILELERIVQELSKDAQ
ncbi:MAG: DUF86 domain-containing protein [Betaproteobacteria bacterium]|nr:DUF86 domain-containing protein [Betaproteobacteria bacterium]